LWRGRITAVLAIVLLALSLRTAVAAISPIVGLINADVGLAPLGLGLLGMLPPLFFALCGFIAPPVARKCGLEAALSLAIITMIAGHLVRALSDSFLVLVLATMVSLLGMGLGNVLLPPAVKRYFPDFLGLMTATYATVMSIGAALPAFVAVPVASALGWRASLGMWAVVTGFALFPWIILWRNFRGSVVGWRETLSTQTRGQSVFGPHAARMTGLWRSPIARAMTLAFSVCSVNAYAAFAWLPQLLVDRAGVSGIDAGVLLALFAVTGLPLGIVAPMLVAKLRRPGRIIHAGVVAYIFGYGGLVVIPMTMTWLWVTLIGLGSIMFPACLVLITVRSKSHDGALALSGFMQGIGYTVGAAGPLVVGLLFELTSDWRVPLLFLLATAVTASFSGSVISRGRFVEDEVGAVNQGGRANQRT